MFQSIQSEEKTRSVILTTAKQLFNARERFARDRGLITAPAVLKLLPKAHIDRSSDAMLALIDDTLSYEYPVVETIQGVNVYCR